jgi:glucose/arabinose dehydrogenase
MSVRKIALLTLGALALGGLGVYWYIYSYAQFDIYTPLYANNCAQCHGVALGGSDDIIALYGTELRYGDTVADLMHSIRTVHLGLDAPQFSETLSDEEIKGLAIYIGEKRLGQSFSDFQFDRDIKLPIGVQTSTAHNFTLETVAEGLQPLVFSIEPLPNGSFLLTEKERGLSIVSAQGVQSELIQGTPKTGGSVDILGLQFGSGWLLDVATHPDYASNGWVYLHHTHLWGDRCDNSPMCKSMNRLIRGRIANGQWVDQEVIWQAAEAFYATTPDTGAGGRIAFDAKGHVYISLGIKSTDGLQDTTAQDLANPYGKIHRVNDNGSIPPDNPFAGQASGAAQDIRDSIWTYGHRSPQGLEWHPVRHLIWNSEMGPRGGDELNELLSGRNYGWPFHSNGLEYLGSKVARHEPKAIEFDANDIQHTLVDITPSPAISSFAFYTGDRFPRWRNDVLIGSLKGSSLFRMTFDGTVLTKQETLIKDLARIRDVEIGYDGLVYLLLETQSGSSIVRLAPAPNT